MKDRALMVQGTTHLVGKSLFIGALCRILAEEGISVAPFQAISWVSPRWERREIGPSVLRQAQAVGVEPASSMNPILLEQVGERRRDVYIHGERVGSMDAREFLNYREELISVMRLSIRELKGKYDLVLLEGAGNPAEDEYDLVNWVAARIASASVLLMADIDKGGLFAYLFGTLSLLKPKEKRLVRGSLVNKFRGDEKRFEGGRRMIEERTGRPLFGLIPFFNDRLWREDPVQEERRDLLRIGIIHLPHISNFTDFQVLEEDGMVELEYIREGDELHHLDLIILPGSKSTIHDLEYIRASGLLEQILERVRERTPLLGICGGYQMMGHVLWDEEGVESQQRRAKGLGLFDLETGFMEEKRVTRSTGTILYKGEGLFKDCYGYRVSGYEIHHGFSKVGCGSPLLGLSSGGRESVDGLVSSNGLVAGTYLHGLFDERELRQQFLSNLRSIGHGHALKRVSSSGMRGSKKRSDEVFGQWSSIVRESIDLRKLFWL